MYLLSVVGAFSISMGDALVLASALGWAVHVHIVGWLAQRVHPSVLHLCGAQLECGRIHGNDQDIRDPAGWVDDCLWGCLIRWSGVHHAGGGATAHRPGSRGHRSELGSGVRSHRRMAATGRGALHSGGWWDVPSCLREWCLPRFALSQVSDLRKLGHLRSRDAAPVAARRCSRRIPGVGRTTLRDHSARRSAVRGPRVEPSR